MKEITKEKFIEGIKKMVEDGVARNESEAMYMFYTQRGNAYKIDGKTIEQLGNDGTLDEWMFGNNTKEDMNEINSSEPTPTPEPMPEKSEEEDLRISGSNKTRAQDILKKYKKIYDEAVRFNKINDHGKGLSGDAKKEYQERLNGYVSQLKDIEQSDEVKQLMNDVYNDGLDLGWLPSEDKYFFRALGQGDASSAVNDGKGIMDGDSFALLSPALHPENVAKAYINKGLKIEDKNPSQEDKKPSQESKFAFGSDVASKYGDKANEYVNKRDDSFAKYLVGKNITSEKKVRELLSKYDSFNSASEDNKERTVKRIMDKIKPLQSEKIDKVSKDLGKHIEGIKKQIDSFNNKKNSKDVSNGNSNLTKEQIEAARKIVDYFGGVIKDTTDGRIEEGDDPYVNDMLGKEIKSNAKPKEETKNTENGAYKGYYSDQQSKAPKKKEKEKSKSGDVFGGILDNLGMGARNYVDNILKRNNNK